MPTILGLVTAGLTVVFQDFILAFCGWFVLMGPNGVRVKDWVEIDGVGGEVVQLPSPLENQLPNESSGCSS
jgi:small-conductance mechanosensitive channel